MKAKRSDFEFYQNMIDMLQQEKATFASLLEAERASASRREESFRQETQTLRETVAELTEQLRKKEEAATSKDDQIKGLMKLLSDLNEKLSNALAAGALARGKRFAPASEKSDSRKADKEDVRAKDKVILTARLRRLPLREPVPGHPQRHRTWPRIQDRQERDALHALARSPS